MNKLAFALLLSSVPLFCADEALPKAETVLDRAIEVTGGKAALEKRHNEVMHGSMEFTGRGVKGTLTVYQADELPRVLTAAEELVLPKPLDGFRVTVQRFFD